MFEPIGSRIIMAERAKSGKTKSGIYLPESRAEESESSLQGVVVAVGPECTLGLEPGDEVVAHLHESLSFREEGTRYFLIMEKGIWAKQKQTH